VFRRGTTEWAVTVRQETRGEAQLTCSLQRMSPLPVFEVLSIQRSEVPEDLL
jgi:hypothetical protein